jgi:hypothetical protein
MLGRSAIRRQGRPKAEEGRIRHGFHHRGRVVRVWHGGRRLHLAFATVAPRSQKISSPVAIRGRETRKKTNR